MALFEGEVARLRADNQTLSEELAQCQADKEFVWSLWKRLQVANPDVTQAVGMVMQREKEKNEMKDRKVFEILQHKDDRLDDFEKTLAKQTKEIAMITAEKANLEKNIEKLEAEHLDLIKEKAQLLEKVSDLTSKESESASREAVRELDRANLELKQKMQKGEEEVLRLKDDCDDLTSLRKNQSQRIHDLEADVTTIGSNYSKLANEHEEAKSLLKKYERELARQKQTLKSKDKELEAVRSELTELWNTHSQANENATQQVDLIHQLHSIQQDQQQMMKNQEDAFSVTSSNFQAHMQMIQAENSELKTQTFDMQEHITDQELLIRDLKRQLEDEGSISSQATQECTATQKKLQTLQNEIERLKSYLSLPQSKTRSSRSRSLPRTERATSPVKFKSPVRGSRRSKSASREQDLHREHDLRAVYKKLELTEGKLQDAHSLLHKKNREMEELRCAHTKRLQRLRCVLRNYKLVKQQLQVTEDQFREGPRRKRVKLKQCHPKALQKEDSDQVWNELSYFRNENKNIHTENLNLQEEVDQLRVKAAHDAATIHELRTCVEQEKEEFNFILEELENRGPSEEQLEDLKKAQKQTAFIESKLRGVSRENRMLNEEKEQLTLDKRALRDEIQRLEQRDTTHRIKIADMKRELLRAQRETRRKRVKKSKTKQYQKSLNNSIKEMSQIFDEFSKDGWENVVESEDAATTDVTIQTELTANTSESLGQAIVHHARECGAPLDSSTPSQIYKTRSRLDKDDVPFPSMHPLTEPVQTRDAALSPIHFLRPSNDLEKDLDLVPSHHMARRDTAVSPIRFSGKTTSSGSGASNRQVITLKKRLEGLHQQVNILKASKENALKAQRELKQQVEQLQAELKTAQQRVQSQKLSSQKLSSELDRVRSEKEALESETEKASSIQGYSESEWQAAQSRIRMLTSESSKQVSSIKQLKEDNNILEERLRKANERVNHLERDLTQKRTLMDDMKLKMKLHQENAQSDVDMLLDAEGKMKNLTESNNRFKVQMESQKQRIAAVTREKHDSDEKVLRLSEEIDKKSKVIADLQRKSSELERTVIAMETTAQQQLHQLANQSEEAIDTAQSRLIQANHRLKEFNKFLKVLSHSLLNSIRQARSLMDQQKKSQPQNNDDFDAVSLKKAQNRACDILNLSQSDIDDMLSVSGESTQKESSVNDSFASDGNKKDKKWNKKWEKILNINEEFSLPLAEIFMDKIDEKTQLSAALQSV